MGTIVAIGGGNVAAGETIKIDKTLRWLTGKKKPTMLFISTASPNEPRYSQSMIHHFSAMGFTVSHLNLILDSYADAEIRSMIVDSDIVYIGGGDSIRLYHVFRSMKIDCYLREAYDKGVILAGISAGAMIWFSYGHTDSLSFYTKDWSYSRFGCLGYIRALFSPHCSGERRADLDRMYKSGESFPGVALEDRTAMVYRDGVCTVIREDEGVNGYVYYPTADGSYRVRIPQEKENFDL